MKTQRYSEVSLTFIVERGRGEMDIKWMEEPVMQEATEGRRRGKETKHCQMGSFYCAAAISLNALFTFDNVSDGLRS